MLRSDQCRINESVTTRTDFRAHASAAPSAKTPAVGFAPTGTLFECWLQAVSPPRGSELDSHRSKTVFLFRGFRPFQHVFFFAASALLRKSGGSIRIALSSSERSSPLETARRCCHVRRRHVTTPYVRTILTMGVMGVAVSNDYRTRNTHRATFLHPEIGPADGACLPVQSRTP